MWLEERYAKARIGDQIRNEKEMNSALTDTTSSRDAGTSSYMLLAIVASRCTKISQVEGEYKLVGFGIFEAEIRGLHCLHTTCGDSWVENCMLSKNPNQT
jgi:hypothetical protein